MDRSLGQNNDPILLFCHLPRRYLSLGPSLGIWRVPTGDQDACIATLSLLSARTFQVDNAQLPRSNFRYLSIRAATS